MAAGDAPGAVDDPEPVDAEDADEPGSGAGKEPGDVPPPAEPDGAGDPAPAEGPAPGEPDPAGWDDAGAVGEVAPEAGDSVVPVAVAAGAVALLALGPGSAEVRGPFPESGSGAAVPDAPDAVPLLRPGAAAGGSPFPPDGRAVGSADTDAEGPTRLAGMSSSCTGTGSQGASELPDSSVTAITAA